MQKIRKAVFPVAGLGTHFLPETKAMPKVMLPIVDKPLIQYAVEEAHEAGITEMIFITGKNKRAIEDHFDSAPELEEELFERKKNELLKTLREVTPKNIKFLFIRQPYQSGLGDAILCAEPAIEDEPFAVILADELIDAQKPAIRQLMDKRDVLGCGNFLAVEEVSSDQTKKYGIVEIDERDEGISKVQSIVEKPLVSDRPAMAVVGRYLLEPSIFDSLKNIDKDKNGEYQLSDAIQRELNLGVPTYASSFEGRRFDCGSRQGFIDATVYYAKKRGFKVDFPE